VKWQQVAWKLITDWEKCKLHAYPDPATGGKPWTIGWGATGMDIGPNTVWTQAQADADLQKRIDKLGESIDGYGVPLTCSQKGALVSLAYNIGIGNLGTSTLLKCLRRGDIAGASSQFLVWNKAAGKVMQGLVNRRKAEKAIFDSPETD